MKYVLLIGAGVFVLYEIGTLIYALYVRKKNKNSKKEDKTE